MAKSKRMMETDEDGNKRQFFPITHISAVLGLREFMEGNFFQANFDQVMAQLQAHYNRVSQEIDKKASEIEQHANQKIEEFDTKISDSDEKIANLETEIKDIQELVESNDIPTRDEVSANVIYQVIGKEDVEIPLTIDLKGKVAGSIVENPSISKRTFDGLATSVNILKPSEFAAELDQVRYNSAANLDNSYTSVTNTPNGYMSQQLFSWNVLEVLKNQLGESFFIDRGATTLSSQIEVAKKIIISAVPSVWCFGKSPAGYSVSVSRYGLNSWGTPTTRKNSEITKITLPDIDDGFWKNNLLQPDGFVYIMANAEAADGVTQSVLNADYANLQLKIRISANEHFKLMIAAYSGENSVSLSEPQTVEGLKNFSDGVQSKGIDVATQDMTKVTLFQSTEISNVKGTAAGIVWPIDETVIVFGGVGAHARRGGTSEPGTIYFNEAGQYLIELLWFVNSGTATRKYVYMDWIKHGTTDLLFRSGIGKINGFSYTSSVPGGGIITMGKDEGVDILLKTNVEDLIAGVKIYYIKITKIG